VVHSQDKEKWLDHGFDLSDKVHATYLTPSVLKRQSSSGSAIAAFKYKQARAPLALHFLEHMHSNSADIDRHPGKTAAVEGATLERALTFST
jgi:hypothetical protein